MLLTQIFKILFMSLKERFKFGFSLSAWIGGVMFIFSIPLSLLQVEGVYAFYFDKSFMFYKIGTIIFSIFVISFLLGSKK